MDTIIEKRKKVKKPTKIEELTKEEIRKAILKKRECNAKAQTIVESLLENSISEEYFLKCLPEINQSHFEDVIEERSILRLCGYPTCRKMLSENDIPKQKYRISLKTNKVYDITVRKSFCSNTCYKSAVYVKKQMLTSPLWFREYEDIPKFQLMPLDTVGSLGQEIDLSLIEKVNTMGTKQLFTSIKDFAEATYEEISKTSESGIGTDNSVNETSNVTTDVETKVEKHNDTVLLSMEKLIDSSTGNIDIITGDSNSSNKELQCDTINEVDNILNKKNLMKDENISGDNKAETKIIKKENFTKPVKDALNIVGDIVEKPEHKIDPIIINKPKSMKELKDGNRKQTPKKHQKKTQPPIKVITIEVEKCLAEWFTLDTMLFLLGEDKVKNMVIDKGEYIKKYLNNYAESIFYNSNSYDQYQQICKKLNMLELEDRRFDTQSLQKVTKPLPDFSILKEESKGLQLKVKAFLSGETDVPKTIAISEQNETHSNENANLTQLPLVDKNAQNALRRRIVCQHLSKVLPDLLRSLGLLTLSINTDVRLLVNTFKLKANNIMFKPLQWTLIAIVIIKLLSLKDNRLRILLEQQMAYQHLQLLLLSYNQDGEYLDRLVSWLIDIDRLLEVSDTQLTIEN